MKAVKIVAALVACLVIASVITLAQYDDDYSAGANAEASASAEASANAGAESDDFEDDDSTTVNVNGEDVEVTTTSETVSVKDGKVDVTTKTGTSVSVSANSALVTKLFEDDDEIDEADFDGLLALDDEIEFGDDGTVTVGDDVVEVKNKRFNIQVRGNDVVVQSEEDGTVSITDGDIEVSAADIKISKGRIKVGEVEIKTASEVIVGDLKVTKKKVELRTEDGKVIYWVEAEDPQRLFFIVPVTVKQQVKIDAATGATINVDAPWWDFLAWG